MSLYSGSGGSGRKKKNSLAERILMNPDYMPREYHAATLKGQLNALSSQCPEKTETTLKKAFLKAGGNFHFPGYLDKWEAQREGWRKIR